MSALMKPRQQRSLINELMFDPFDSFFCAPPLPVNKMNSHLMKTDIEENDESYLVHVDLPGFKKENIEAQVKDGVLTISAQNESEKEETDKQGSYLRRERFSGKCSRSFYVGEEILEDEISGSFENGILEIMIPKKQPQPKLEESKKILIC